MRTELITVTPELARLWLKSNIGNRNIKPLNVIKYAKDMRNGTWTTTHQGVAFDHDGLLADGQHRLMAIISADVAVDMLVTFGVDRGNIDRLAPRSEVDDVKFSGASPWIDAKCAAIANAIYELAKGGRRRTERTTSEFVEFCEQNKDAIIFARGAFTKNIKFISAGLVQGVVAIASKYEDAERVSEFVKILYSGMPKDEGDFMAIRARDFLLSGGTVGGSVERKRAAKVLSRAIYLFCRHQDAKRLRAPDVFCYPLDEVLK